MSNNLQDFATLRNFIPATKREDDRDTLNRRVSKYSGSWLLENECLSSCIEDEIYINKIEKKKHLPQWKRTATDKFLDTTKKPKKEI